MTWRGNHLKQNSVGFDADAEFVFERFKVNITSVIFNRQQQDHIKELANGSTFDQLVNVTEVDRAVRRKGLGGTLEIANSVVSGNSADLVEHEVDLRGEPTSGGHNLIGWSSDPADFPTVAEGGTNVLDATPELGPLADNGGPTLTHALLPGSPAIDAGFSSLATDQRGVSRGVDLPGVPNVLGGNFSDIGSFELQLTEPLGTLQLVQQSESSQLVLSGDHELRDEVFGSDF